MTEEQSKEDREAIRTVAMGMASRGRMFGGAGGSGGLGGPGNGQKQKKSPGSDAITAIVTIAILLGTLAAVFLFAPK